MQRYIRNALIAKSVYAMKQNQKDFEHYKATLERARIRYQIDDAVEQEDGLLIVRVRKQYNEKTDVSEYFK